MPDEMEERIEMDLSYGDSKSEWIRDAVILRIATDPILDEMYEPHQREQRHKLVVAALREKVNKIKEQNRDKTTDELIGDVDLPESLDYD